MSFQLDELCEALSDAQIRSTLSNLPDGLADTYERNLSKIRQSRQRAVIALKIFKWMACAQRPLETDELQEAVAFGASDKCWDGDKIPDEDLMIESCRGLIIREIDKTVRFAHHTVQQYLLSENSHGEVIRLSIKLKHAHAFVGQMCVTYLLFSDFETPIARQAIAPSLSPAGISRPGGSGWISRVLGYRKSIIDIVYRVYGRNPDLSIPNVEWEKYLHPTMARKESIPLEYTSKYRLLRYVTDFWVIHTREYGPPYRPDRFDDLVRHRDLPFQFRPWGVNQHLGPYGCCVCPRKNDISLNKDFRLMSLFHYAAEHGHWSLMKPLVKQYCRHEGSTAMTQLIACRHRQSTIIKKLLDTYVVNDRDLLSPRTLTEAAASGHLDVFQILILKFQELGSMNHPGPQIQESFCLAAANGHETIVDYLLSNHQTWDSTPLNIDDIDRSTGASALISAAKHGHDATVRRLLAAGIDLNETSAGSSALHYAVEHGHLIVVRTLLQCSAAQETLELGVVTTNHGIVNRRDQSGRTALHKAADRDDNDMVELLLENGADTEIAEIGTAYVESGLLAAHLAIMNGHVDVLQTIMTHTGKSVRSLAIQRRTALYMAAEQGHANIVRWLVANHADVNELSESHVANDGRLELPLEVALRRGHKDAALAMQAGGDYPKVQISGERQ